MLLGRCFGPYLWKGHLHTCQVLGTLSPGAPQPSLTVQPVFPYLPLSTTCTDGIQLFTDSMKLVGPTLKRVYQPSGTSYTSSRRVISTSLCTLMMGSRVPSDKQRRLDYTTTHTATFYCFTCIRMLKLTSSNLVLTPLSKTKVCTESQCGQLLAKVPVVTMQQIKYDCFAGNSCTPG